MVDSDSEDDVVCLTDDDPTPRKKLKIEDGFSTAPPFGCSFEEHITWNEGPSTSTIPHADISEMSLSFMSVVEDEDITLEPDETRDLSR